MGWDVRLPGSDEGFEMLLNTIDGYVRHPNFAGVLIIGLGCEVLQIDTLLNNRHLTESPGFADHDDSG